MKASSLARLVFVALFSSFACAREASENERPTSARLAADVVARVDREDVTAAQASRVLAEQGGSSRGVVDGLVRDALLARAAREREDVARVGERAVLGRALREALLAEARASGPITDEELARVAEERWLEVDRPRAVRVVHAVALGKTPEARVRAAEVAKEIERSVVGHTEARAFAEAAHAVAQKHADVQVRIEPLPPVAEDGRVVPVDELDRGGAERFESAFAKGAAKLERAGDISGVVETSYGFHVILALEIVPELRLDADLRREVLEPRALALRAEPGHVELVAQLQQSTPVEIVRNFDQLTLQAWTPR